MNVLVWLERYEFIWIQMGEISYVILAHRRPIPIEPITIFLKHDFFIYTQYKLTITYIYFLGFGGWSWPNSIIVNPNKQHNTLKD